MAAFDFSSSFAGINGALGRLGQQNELAWQRERQGEAAADFASGNYAGAAGKLAALGQFAPAASLAQLGQAQKQIEGQNAISTLFAGGGGAPSSAATASAANLGTPNEIENRFVNTVKGAGLTNPVGLGAVAAYGKAESGFAPQNVNRSWSDPSESGQPGTAGGIMSWRAERLQNLQNFAKQRGEQQPSVETQALFLAQENPQLIPALQAAKTPQEANQIMANAWRFAGYNRPGGENARRLALTQGYAQRFGGQGGPAPAVPPQVAMNEADVQRLEAQQGNPVVGAPGAAPLQVAQAPAQPGAPVADIPAQGAADAGFNPPGANMLPPNDPVAHLSTKQLLGITMNPNASDGQRAMAKSIIDSRQKYSDENAPDKREMTRLQTEKLRREVQGDSVRSLITAEERAQYGVDPDYKGTVQVDRQGKLSFPGKPATEVNVQKGENKFEEEMGKGQAKRFNDLIAEGDVAQGRLADIQTLRDTSRRLGSQGSSANLKATIGPYAESLGIKVDGLSDIQLYESITQRLAPTLRAPGSGSTSDIEFKGFQRAIGPLSNTPAAREMILDTFEAASRNDVARADIASRLAQKEITRGQAEKELRSLPNPLEAFREFRKQNPDLVGQALKESARVDHEQRNAPAVLSADAYSKLKPGDKYTDPDGNVRTKR